MPIQEDLVLTASAKSISKRGQILGSQVDAKFGGTLLSPVCTRACARLYSAVTSVSDTVPFRLWLARPRTRACALFLSPSHPGKVPHVSVPWSRVKEADTEMWLLSVSAAWPPFPRISVTGAQVRIGQWPHCVVKKPLPSGLGPPYRHTLHCTGLPGRQLRLVLCLATRSGRYVPRDSQNSRGAATSTSKDPAGSAIPREGHLPVRG